MPKIVINELDLTTPGVASESTDIVYIPGFVDPDLALIEVGKPELFTSVAAFNTRCGSAAPKFNSDQPIPSKFAPAATKGLNTGAVMFKAGTEDPAYVMAKELLAAGIGVLYERVNEVDIEYEKVTLEKDKDGNLITENNGTNDWYYINKNGKYKSYNVPDNKEALDDGVDTTPVYIPYEDDNTYKVSSKGAIHVDTMYNYLGSAYQVSDTAGISDRGNYSVKYLTSGGYPTFEYDSGSIVTSMLALAEKRGDCVALIDHLDNPKRSINPNSGDSVYSALQTGKSGYKNGDFGAMFTPWATYNRTTSDYTEDEDSVRTTIKVKALRAPASFAYLMSLADSIKTNANWLAIAGAARGGVLNLADGGMDVVIPNGVADAMQPRKEAIAINAITNIKPYGMTIWGNRTMKPITDNLVATDFLNIRNLISDIKKTCYRTARKATFEQDTDILWVNFKSEIAKLLERMKSGYGISGYKIVRDYDHAMAAEKATLCAKIIIYPTYAVEDFYITVVLQDDEVSVN
jgi:hypothetical protein